MDRDFAFALRQLRTNLRFSVIVVLTLALGIGATTAIFSVVSGVLLRALPFPEPERIVSLQTIEYPHSEMAASDTSVGTDGGVFDDVSFPDFFDWRQQSKTLESVASFASGTTRKFSPDGTEMPRLVDAEFVSGDFFRVLGVSPILGRTFTVDDERDENHPIILSYAFWVSDFHSSPNIVGKHIRISDRVRTIIGVMPPGFTFPGHSEAPAFWGTFLRGSYDGVSASGIAQKETISPTSRRNDRPTQVMARLKPGVGIAQARAEMNAIQRSLAEQYPEDRNAYGVEVQSLLDYVSDSGGYRKALYLLFAAVTALLLIACANVAGLLLARGFARRHEFSVRVALGAKPAQIIRQVLIESAVLALCGGAIGVGIALALLKTVLVLAPADLPRINQVRIDWIVMAFAFAISLVTGIAFGVFPAWAASRSDSSGLWRAGRGISGGRSEHRLRAIFVIAETAISLVLLGGSGLLIGSFVETMRVPPGFDPHHVLSFRLGMSARRISAGKIAALFSQIVSASRCNSWRRVGEQLLSGSVVVRHLGAVWHCGKIIRFK